MCLVYWIPALFPLVFNTMNGALPHIKSEFACLQQGMRNSVTLIRRDVATGSVGECLSLQAGTLIVGENQKDVGLDPFVLLSLPTSVALLRVPSIAA